MQTPVFKGHVDLVRIDIAVIDNKTGKAIPGLTERDFTVAENGVRQTISSFLAKSGGGPPDPARAEPAATENERRVFLLAFGNGYLSGPVDPYDGAARFLRERLRAQDLAAVMAWDRVTGLTTDHEQLAQVVERLERVPKELAGAYLRDPGDISPKTQAILDDWMKPPGAPADFLRSASALLLATPEYFQNGQITRWNQWICRFDILKVSAGIAYLRNVEGEKHLVLMSRFGLRPPFSLRGEGIGMRLESAEDDRRLAVRANDSKVTLNIVHTIGTDWIPFSTLSSAQVTQLTGGGFTSVRTAEQQLARIDDGTRNGYILGYVPTKPGFDGKYRNVTVSVNRKNVTVVYRRGYTAQADSPPVDPRELIVRARMDEAAAADMPMDDIKVQVNTATVVRSGSASQVRVEIKIDSSQLSLTKADDKWVGTINLMVLCGDDRQHVVGKLDQQMTVSLDNAHYRQVVNEGIPYMAVVPFTGRVVSAKIIVYDLASDRVGTAYAPVK